MAAAPPRALFTSLLMQWHRKKNTRKMPWKGVKDPYRVWLSEIILQQTRVDQGEKYYLNFINHYPTIRDLAQGDESEIFRLWQGLGYYNRCRNMIQSAKTVQDRWNGVFPDNYQDILSLKGVGEYSAAAIASFAFGLPYAVVDGNVVRVLSRVFELRESFYNARGKKIFQTLAQDLLDKTRPDLYNQAIMDLGAIICKPLQPDCERCPCRDICRAFLTKSIEKYPVKKQKAPLKHRHFHFMVLHTRNNCFFIKRSGNDIWKDLHTFYSVETDKYNSKLLPQGLKRAQISHEQTLMQTLSHQKIHGHFYNFFLLEKEIPPLKGLIKIKKAELEKLAFPRMILDYLRNNFYL